MANLNQKNISILLAEDAWQGDANAIVRVDGAVAWQGAVTAAYSSQGGLVDLGSYDTTVSHTVSVEFTNDAYGGTSDTDRNLFVKDILVDGVSTGINANLYSAGTSSFNIHGVNASGPVSLGGTGPDTVTLSINEDAYLGDAQFIVTLDGVQVGGVQTANVLRSSGNFGDFTFSADLGTSGHQIGVQFLNDAWGGTADTDRNLFVNSVKVNGTALSAGKQDFYSNGAGAWTVAPKEPITIGSGSQSLSVVLNEDAYLGDAQFTVNIDGKQVGGIQTASALHKVGGLQEFTFKGDFGTGEHKVDISFINDAWGGTADTDRNLYVESVSMDGAKISSGETVLFANGTASVSGSFAASTPVTPVVPPVTPPVVTPVTEPVTPPVVTPVVPPVTPPVVTPVTEPVTPPVVTPVVPPVVTPVTPPVIASHYGADSSVGLTDVTTPVLAPGTRILTVGVDKMYSTVSAAVNASQNGDAVAVDAGTYTNDFMTVNSKITMYAVGGRVIMNATVPPPNYKGIITQETDLTVIGFTFNGVRIPDEQGHNGAGIRVDNGNLVLINDEFTNNQDGVLTNAGKGISVTIDHSVFNGNGGNDGNGAGNIHAIYIGDVAFAKVTNSIFENTLVGHEFKSRAESNTLNNNVFISGVGTGTGSYDIDIPNGGKAIITNNTIIKGPNAENSFMVHFGGEGIPYAGSSLTVKGNLFQNTKDNAHGILNQTALTATVSGNKLNGLDYGIFVQGPAKISSNVNADNQPFTDQILTGVLPGSTMTYTDTADHNVVLDSRSGISAIEGGAGHLTIDDQGGHVVVIGGSGGIDLVEAPGAGGSQFTTAAGSVNSLTLNGYGINIIDSEGTDTIITGNANRSGVLGGISTVTGGMGADSWTVNGQSTYTTIAGSSTFFSLSAPSSSLSILGYQDFYKVDNNGGTLIMNSINAGVHVSGVITGGAWSMQTYNGLVHLSTANGSSGANITMGEGDMSVASGGADIIHAGSGNTSIQAAGGATIYAGTGHLDVFTRGASGVSMYGNGGQYKIDGDSGGLTYYGGDKDSTVDAHVAYLTLTGQSGHLTVNGGGRSNIIGGSGGLTFNENGGGANTVTTAAGSTNSLFMSGDDVINSYGNDTIAYGVGNSYGFNLYGNSKVSIAGGGHYVYVGGHTNMTVAGHSFFTLGTGASMDMTASGDQFIALNGSSAAVHFTNDAGVVASAGAYGTAQISTNSGGGIEVNTSSTDRTFVVAGDNTHVDSNGADIIYLGGGTNSVTTLAAGTEIWAGSGNANINDPYGSGNFLLHGESANLVINAGASGMTFIGGSGNALVSASRGVMAVITGGDGNITTAASGQSIASFTGGSGKADLSIDDSGSNITFGAGDVHIHELGFGNAVVYNLTNAAAGGVDIIDNFRVGTDKLVLAQGVSVASQGVNASGAFAIMNTGESLKFTGLISTQNLFS